MALTLAEASKLSNDVLLQGVVETIVKDSPVLQKLPFIEIVGNVLTYNQEQTLGITISILPVLDTPRPRFGIYQVTPGAGYLPYQL